MLKMMQNITNHYYGYGLFILCMYCAQMICTFANYNVVTYKTISSRSALQNRNCQLYTVGSNMVIKSSIKCGAICSKKWTCFSYQLYGDMCLLCLISHDNVEGLLLYSEPVPENTAIYERKELPLFEDCAELNSRTNAAAISDVYKIYIRNSQNTKNLTIPVLCDMDNGGGGWIVFQKRFDGSVAFTQTWEEYKNGFGDLHGEFWLGNDVVYRLLSSSTTYELRVDLEAFTGEKRYAQYGNFKLGAESDNFRLSIGSYSGTAGDFLQGLLYHNGMEFSTKDNDPTNCASSNGEAGFWYKFCRTACVNCDSPANSNPGIKWLAWANTPIKATSMKFRPVY